MTLDRLVGSQNAEHTQLLRQYPASKGTLDNVGTIQAVHAVRAHDTRLGLARLALVIVVVTLLHELLLELINQKLDAIPTHALAFTVEVEMGIVETRVVELLDGAGVRLAHGELVTLFVDQVHEDLRAIDADLLIKVGTGGGQLSTKRQ